MRNCILFLRALDNHIGRLATLLDKQWPDVRGQLKILLKDLLSEPNEDALPARVNRIYRCFKGTAAETLVRSLFQQANEEVDRMGAGTRSVIFTDPTTQETCSVDLRSGEASDGPIKREELRAAAKDFELNIGFHANASSRVFLDVDKDAFSRVYLGVHWKFDSPWKPETRSTEQRINAWISERVGQPSLPLKIGERYTLNLGVGRERVGSLITGKDATVPQKDLADGGLQTEWVVSTSAFEISSSDPTTTLSVETLNVHTAKFSLLIPENTDSEVRQLLIMPRSPATGRLEVLIFAVRAQHRELYRQFSVKVPVEDSKGTAELLGGTAIVNEWTSAPSGHMNLKTTHEWTTPPGRLMLTVLPGVQKVYVNGDLPNRHVNEFVDWHGQQAALSGSIDNVRDFAEKFRGKWQAYLNDIDKKDLAARLSGFTPIYDWSYRQSRADSEHTEQWKRASTSTELRELAIYGHELYQTVFPPDKQLRGWIDSLVPGTRLDITWKVDEPGSGNVPNVPWGLMYQPDPTDVGKAVDPMGFLALRFRLGYWGYQGVSDGSKALGAIANTHQTYCLYWGDNPNDETGREAAWQRQQFQQWQNQVFVPQAPDSPNAHAELLKAFLAPTHSPTSVLYFFCQAAVGDGNKPVLRFGPTSGPTDVLQTTDLLIGKKLVDQPLVFANACTTSSADPYVANLLQQNLFRRGCRGFLGTETKVPIQLASRFAEIFFHFFYRKADQAPMAAGEALAQTRLFLLTEYANIGGIFYTYLNQYELYMASDSEVQALRPR